MAGSLDRCRPFAARPFAARAFATRAFATRAWAARAFAAIWPPPAWSRGCPAPAEDRPGSAPPAPERTARLRARARATAESPREPGPRSPGKCACVADEPPAARIARRRRAASIELRPHAPARLFNAAQVAILSRILSGYSRGPFKAGGDHGRGRYRIAQPIGQAGILVGGRNRADELAGPRGGAGDADRDRHAGVTGLRGGELRQRRALRDARRP